MKPLLAHGNRSVIAELGRGRTLLAFDFDGTLAPIAQREEARMSVLTERLFRELCAAFPCAVVSGRSVADLDELLGSTRPAHVIGNHGLEPSALMTELLPELEELRRALWASLGSVRDVDIEDKRYSVALHYRTSDNPRRARRRIRAALATLTVPTRVVLGKRVVNVVHARAPHKGDALAALCVQERAERALFAGDDVTDEDAFRLQMPGLVTVRVGRSRSSAAEYFLPRQADIDHLLERLLAARRG